MLHRSALCFGFVSFVLAIGCSAPPGDVAKNGKQVTGSPNDPGFQPPGANPGSGPDDTTEPPGDDTQEQPGPNGCIPRNVPIPNGWAVHALTDLDRKSVV